MTFRRQALSHEACLRAIYDLTHLTEPVEALRMARTLDLKPAAVSGLFQRLARFQPPLVKYVPRDGVWLAELQLKPRARLRLAVLEPINKGQPQ